MTIEETLSEFTTMETLLFAVGGGVAVVLIIYGVIKLSKRLWRPKDKTKPRLLYSCPICRIPCTTQMGLVNHMKNVHDTIITPSEAKTITEEVSYETWEQIRLDEESKLEEFEENQDKINERVVTQLTGNPDNDPEQIVEQDSNQSPIEIYNEISTKIEKPSVSKPTDDLFNVQYSGNRIVLDIATTMPNTSEVREALDKLIEAMGK